MDWVIVIHHDVALYYWESISNKYHETILIRLFLKEVKVTA